VGWAIACEELTSAIRKVHDFVTVGAAAPLQRAGAHALGMPDEYYVRMADLYRGKRDRLVSALRDAGFGVFVPSGAYYVMTDISPFGFQDDAEFARFLVSEIGVAAVPGSSFYLDAADGRERLRFNFCKRDETLDQAILRLAQVRERCGRG
jgi:aminotransferase